MAEVEVARSGPLSHPKTRHQPGPARRGARRARKVDRRLGSGCVGSAAVGPEFWLLWEGSGIGRGQVPAWTRS